MKMKISILLLAISFLLPSLNYGQNKLDLKVLYVGYQPDKPLPEKLTATAIGGMSEERFKEDYKTRYPAFMDYLGATFSNVKGVDSRDYKAELSEGYDVTIFDQTPPPIADRVMEMDANGQVTKYVPAKYIEESFDHATVFISHTAPVMAQPIGAKLDWYCLCLDADAHRVQTEHPIFKGPLKVSLTFETKPTPEGALNYPGANNLPKEIPMWRVQKEGYLEGNGYRVGLVSRPNGFLDSPDTEFIAGGVSSKAIDAVAIGRHGNFFLWGFSASPDFMTEEAKKVFANAVVYMKQFKGQKPIARKDNDRIQTRHSVDYFKYLLTQEQFERSVKVNNEFYEESVKKHAAAKAKKEKGEPLTKEEEMFLDMTPQKREITWESYLERYMNGYAEKFGTDVAALNNYLDENIEYLFHEDGKGLYGLTVDEDVKALGVSNRKIELLETCIDLLKKGKQTELAKRVLVRYTDEDFATAAEWSKWLKTNKDKLFFTESGGYKWLVNTL